MHGLNLLVEVKFMKKTGTKCVLFLTLLILSSFVALIKIQPATAETTLTVDDDGSADFSTIQEAVNAANEGDTIFVHSGTYDRFRVRDKNDIKIVGENKENTFIDGMVSLYPYSYGIAVSGCTAEISGFTVKNWKNGFYISWYGIADVTNNIVEDNVHGIFVGNCSYYSTVSQNVITGNECGLHVGLDSDNNIITDNSILANNFGIEISFSSDNLIYGNYFVANINQSEVTGGYIPSIDLLDESVNAWDNGLPLGGNYWEDYLGIDSNGDGFGDTPYVIDENNQDAYPLMNQLSDLDRDSIYNDVDVSPFLFSDEFSDSQNGGATLGYIITRGEQTITIKDEPDTAENDYGLRITSDPTGGDLPAIVTLDGNPIEIGAGVNMILTYGSVHIKVITGTVQATFTADDGKVAIVELIEGNEIIVEPSTLTITNDGEIEAVVFVDEVQYSLAVGIQIRFATLVSITPDTLNLASNGKWITANIALPQPYDANQIDLESVKLIVNNNELGADLTAPVSFADYDGDGMVDLSIKFLRQPIIACLSIVDYSGDTNNVRQEELTVSGVLNDGTLFQGKDTVKILNSKK